jgi:hypothetical protein
MSAHERARAQLLKAFGVLLSGLALAGPAAAVPFAWDPGAVGLNGASAFGGDALKATEVSRIHFTSPSTWEEHGYAKITGILSGGAGSVPNNLNTAGGYSLYFKFDGTGDFFSASFTTATMTLYGVNGAANFGIDGNNNAYVDNGANTPVALAVASLLNGTSGGAPGGDLFADLWTSFAATAAGAAMFQAPTLPAELYGHFFHPVSEAGGITLITSGGNLTDVVLRGGDDTLSFVPEPASALLLLAGGLPGVWLRRRRSAA